MEGIGERTVRGDRIADGYEGRRQMCTRIDAPS